MVILKLSPSGVYIWLGCLLFTLPLYSATATVSSFDIIFGVLQENFVEKYDEQINFMRKFSTELADTFKDARFTVGIIPCSTMHKFCDEAPKAQVIYPWHKLNAMEKLYKDMRINFPALGEGRLEDSISIRSAFYNFPQSHYLGESEGNRQRIIIAMVHGSNKQEYNYKCVGNKKINPDELHYKFQHAELGKDVEGDRLVREDIWVYILDFVYLTNETGHEETFVADYAVELDAANVVTNYSRLTQRSDLDAQASILYNWVLHPTRVNGDAVHTKVLLPETPKPVVVTPPVRPVQNNNVADDNESHKMQNTIIGSAVGGIAILVMAVGSYYFMRNPSTTENINYSDDEYASDGIILLPSEDRESFSEE